MSWDLRCSLEQMTAAPLSFGRLFLPPIFLSFGSRIMISWYGMATPSSSLPLCVCVCLTSYSSLPLPLPLSLCFSCTFAFIFVCATKYVDASVFLYIRTFIWIHLPSNLYEICLFMHFLIISFSRMINTCVSCRSVFSPTLGCTFRWYLRAMYKRTRRKRTTEKKKQRKNDNKKNSLIHCFPKCKCLCKGLKEARKIDRI